jgi:O-succinylbenzoate synthase
MVQFKVFVYEIPVSGRGKTYFPSGHRDGLFLKIGHKDNFFTGEYAPLARIHKHSITCILPMISEFLSKNELNKLSELDESLGLDELDNYFQKFPYPLGYILSMSHYHRLKKRIPNQLHDKKIKLAALIDDENIHSAVASAQAYNAQGYMCLKVKVGNLSISDEIKKIKTIVDVSKRHTKIRLDANRRLNFKDAFSLLYGLKKVNLEYFEEPVNDISLAKNLYEEFGVKCAVDESFLTAIDFALMIKLKINFLVIKPSRFLNIFQVIDLAKKAKFNGIEPILSHCFESQFSTAIFSHLIHDCLNMDQAHGLHVDSFLKQNIFSTPLRAFRGQLFLQHASKVYQETPILFSRLLKQVAY